MTYVLKCKLSVIPDTQCKIWLVDFLFEKKSKSQAEVFYYVNYVDVNYSVKNSTVDCKYLLYFL